MKKIYYTVPLAILFVSFIFLTNTGTIGAPTTYGKSILENQGSKAKISEAKKVSKPLQVSDEKLDIGASAYLVVDRETGTPILEKNAGEKKPIASITKLVTALVALDGSKPSDVVETKSSYSDMPSPKMGIFNTEEITLENLLNGMLIGSDNDAAEAVADYIGKGNYKAFVSLMNNKADELGMTKSHFSNAVGLDSPENYSTAWDLSILADNALDNVLIKELAKTQEKRVKNVDGSITHYIKSTNELLGDKDVLVYGLKTGETPEAGGCLVSYAKTKTGHEIVTVVLGSNDRFGDTKKLIQWIEKNIVWN